MQFLATLEKEAQRHLQPLFHRLPFVPRQELRELSRRIGQLERHLRLHETGHATPSPASNSPALDSVQHADLFWDEV